MNNSNRSTVERRQPESIQHRVMKSVSEYNKQLNQERKEDRRVCMDSQTYTIQYPVGLGRENKGLRHWAKRRRGSTLWRGGRRYPVALLPTQYQDWFLQYSSQELKYFPLNTATNGPTISTSELDKLPPMLEVVNGNNSDSDVDGSDVLSDLDDDSSCSCGEDHCSPVRKNGTNNTDGGSSTRNSRLMNYDENSCPPNLFSANASMLPNSSHLNQSMPNLTALNGSNKEPGHCRVCKRDITNQKEALVCADCGVMAHPVCLDISGDLLEAIRLYKWQCMDCKSCNQCGMPHSEDRMLCCDLCDRGYHTYCVGLDNIPDGHWVCTLCASCANCGSKKASETSTTIQWQHELIKIHSPDGQMLIRHQLFCETCYQLRKI